MFSKESIAYLKTALSQHRVFKGPLDLQILPTTRCNARCVFCPMFAVSKSAKQKFAPRWLEQAKDLNPGILDHLIDDLYRLGGLKRVHITGGEPLVYSHIIPLLFLLRRDFPDVELALVTNGILLKQFARAICMIGLDRISISVNAGTSKSYSRQMGIGEEKFYELWEGIEQVSKFRQNKKPFISLTAVLNRFNYSEVKELFELTRNSGADALTFISLMDFPFAGEPVREYALSEAEYQEFSARIEELKPLAEKSGIYLGFTGKDEHLGKLRAGDIYQKLPCYSGYVFAMIYPDGSVRPCCNCEQVLGKLTEKSFYEIWKGEEAQKIRDRMLKIPQLGPPQQCDCLECGYIFENEKFHQLLEENE